VVADRLEFWARFKVSPHAAFPFRRVKIKDAFGALSSRAPPLTSLVRVGPWGDCFDPSYRGAGRFPDGGFLYGTYIQLPYFWNRAPLATFFIHPFFFEEMPTHESLFSTVRKGLPE